MWRTALHITATLYRVETLFDVLGGTRIAIRSTEKKSLSRPVHAHLTHDRGMVGAKYTKRVLEL